MRGKTVTPRKPKSRPHTWPPPSPSPLFCVLSVDEGTSGKDARRTDPTEAPLSPDPQAQVGCTVRTKDALTHCAPPEERLTHTAGASHWRESPSHRDSVSQGHSVTFLSVCLFFPSSFFFFFVEWAAERKHWSCNSLRHCYQLLTSSVWSNGAVFSPSDHCVHYSHLLQNTNTRTGS